MRKNTQFRFIKQPLFAAMATLALTTPASADDLDVFSAVLNSQNKPNILFVLDYSGSMNRDVNDKEIPSGDTTTESKFKILNSAVNSVLADNVGKINVGLGSLYNEVATGVRWPISGLDANANTIDPNIPSADNITVADVIAKQMARNEVEKDTATVNGLAEAAAYFRADPVLHGGRNVKEPWHHKPDTWNTGSSQYSGGNNRTAMPSSYTPSDAYKPGVSNGSYGYCTNYKGGRQDCDGKTTYDCKHIPGKKHVWGASADGGGGSWDAPDRDVCKYQHPDSWTTPNYVSPITKQCQANFIVLISDGQPTRLNKTKTLDTVLNAAGVADVGDCADLSTTIFNGSPDNTTNGNCGPEILEYLATTNINPTISDSKVKTFTVGFAVEGPGKEYLKLLANKGEGDFYEASKPAELTKALNDVVDSILAGSQNFAELSIGVDPTTFSHDNRTYFSLFSPSSRASWSGNLKGFFVDETGLIDVNGNAATVNDGTGIKLADTSQSFWSANVDGNDVVKGGASESISELAPAPNTRNIYTYLGGSKTLSLNAAARIEKDNIGIDDAMMGSPGALLRAETLDWLANAPMGDPLHTKPVVVNYGATKVVYVMTNQGFLHAFDATKPTEPGLVPADVTGGEELFAFMPKELLSNVSDIYTRATRPGHIYGLDGAITRWHTDHNKDGIVNGTDTVTLVFGMRRGGSTYYALDVTDPQHPKYKWQIDKSTPGFAKLAQSWSRASLISVQHGTDTKRVVMFGGGYDAAAVDGKLIPTPATGNAVFMVDEDGTLVWSIDELDDVDMKYSVASDLTVIDTDQNGKVDRAYFGDLGGQVWRVDFNNVANKADTTVTKLADVNNGSHQPIFYAPSVSYAKEKGKRYMAVAFGTGDRTQPMLDSTQNAFFMLKDWDYKTGAPDASFTTITAATIYDATENKVGSSVEKTRNDAKVDLQNARGWTVNLEPGEKSLSKVVTFEGKFLATTFKPDTPLNALGNPEKCSFGMIGRLYVMDLADARPIQIQSDGSETEYGLVKANRTTRLNGTTIPSKPVVVFPANSAKAQIFVDKESVTAVNKKITTVFWHAK